ncbi:MAG TPA: hypothetical protein VGG01_16460 [Xanthobacteraceae bacterium]
MVGALRHFGRLFALGGGLFAGAASAQQQPDTSTLLRQFISDPGYQAAVWNRARKQAAAMPDHCADVKAADEKVGIGIAAPVAFEKRNGRDFPSSGAWIVHLNADACGTRRQLNVLTIAKAGGAVDLVPLYRGTTRADPVLQRDATLAALATGTVAANRADVKGCKSALVVDTRVVSIDAKPQPKVMPGRSPYAWHEIWTIDYCGRPFEAAIDFTPDPTGTGFNAHLPTSAK